METTRVSTKGQIVLPKSIRDELRWTTGTELVIENRPEGVVLRPAKLYPPTTLDQVAGCLNYKGPRKSIRSMDKAIAKEVSRRSARGRY
jgi:AbrB family looped-hinge helix DNA binding protein